jgi:Carboxypeptidase regulatory-like domain
MGPNSPRRNRWLGRRGLVWLTAPALFCAFPVLAQPQQPPTPEPSPSTISGTVIAQNGALLGGAQVRLTRDDQSSQEVVSGDDGQFSFANVAPGAFQITIIAEGFTTKTTSGTLHAGEAFVVPQITLPVAPEITEVPVTLSRVEEARAEVKEEEKQRVLAIVPNFYVSYVPDAAPLSSKEKFELAFKSSVDPVAFVIVGFWAGIGQASNSFSGYGQGGQGYGKRYGAGFADATISTFIGGAVLPSILKQDPRYFYKGVGTKTSRLLYALANAVICKSDKGRWMPNYSNVLGSLAAGGISNAYYPASDRGAGLVFENTAVGLAASGIGNVFQEFVVKKLTPHLPKRIPPGTGKP